MLIPKNQPALPLSVLYVVRNEEKLIEKSIRSIHAIADEIVIVDTGSCDRTLQICRGFKKVKISTHAWVHDFSKTKNYGLRQCSCKWVLCMDADEILDEASATVVRSAITNPKKNVLAYSLHIVDHEKEWGPLASKNKNSFFGSPQTRLFSTEKGFHFDGRVRESSSPCIKRAKGGINLLDATIHHYLWRGKDPSYKYLKLRYYNKLGGDFDLGEQPNMVARENQPSTTPKVAVVMAGFNGLSMTKQSLSALCKNTKVPYDLYFVDNGSTDGTSEFVRQSLGKNPIRNDHNTGVAKARNLATREALKDPSVKYVCYLDNDTKVTEDWLRNMLKVMEENEKIGIVGPLSPSASGAQNITQPRDKTKGAKVFQDLVLVEEIDRFCMLVKTKVLGEIGLFDDSFGPYGYEETDLCRRARVAGFDVAIATEVFIGHRGGGTLKANQMNWNRLTTAAMSRYAKKWKEDEPPAGAIVPKSIGSVGNLLERQADSFGTPRTSIVIIAHNRLDVTKNCLKSIMKYTSNFELVFIDNASSDGTDRWVKSLGKSTYIRNDRNLGVAKARNQGLRASTCDFIVMMDNDIVVRKGWLEELFNPLRDGKDIVGIEAWQLGKNHTPIQQCTTEGQDFDYLGGACCLFKRKVFEEVGLLDEGFRAYYEDVDISIRAKENKLVLCWQPTIKIKHEEHATLIHGNPGFDYRDEMAKSYERFRNKMEGKLNVEHEKLPPLNKKLKVLYLGMYDDYGDPNRGRSFEEHNFHASLQAWPRTDKLIHFDFVDLARRVGVPRMSQLLLDAVYRNQPDVMFCVFYNDQHDPRKEVISRIGKCTPTKTLGWFCDSHWRYDSFDRSWADSLSFCVTTSEMAYKKYLRDGFKDKAIKSQWGASPSYRKIEGTKKDIDVSFVGQPHGDRRSIIEALRRAGIDVKVFGHGWESRLGFDDMILMFNRSKINLNLNNSCNVTCKQIKGRNFEVPACGGFLLTEKAENLHEYYKYGKQVETYDNTDGLINQIRYYLKHEGKREEIAKKGYERTMRDHTYSSRFDNIFSRAGLL